MTKRYLVTRHIGALYWNSQLKRDVDLESLDPAIIKKGDIVYGTLPIGLAAEVIKRGGRFVNLTLNTPKELRGKELGSKQMSQSQARLEEYFIERRISDLDVCFDQPQAAKEPRLIVMAIIHSKETLSNLLPALHFKPDRVIIFNSGEMPDRLGWLRDALIKFGRLTDDKIDHVRIGNEYSAIKDVMDTSLSAYARTSTLIANVTGGTKPMAIALTEVTRRLGGEAAYYDGARRQFDVLSSSGPPVVIPADLLTVETWLAAYGQGRASIASSTNAQMFIPLARRLVECLRQTGKDQVRPLHDAIGKFNDALKKNPSPPSLSKSAFKEELFELLKADGVLVDSGSSEFTFNFSLDEQSKFYGGNWCEYWVLDALHQMGLDNAVSGVALKVDAPSASDENELDVVALQDNLPIIIECKACIVKGGDPQNWLNKLAAVSKRAASGLAVKVLVSLNTIDNAAHLSIAHKENISIIHGEGILDQAKLKNALAAAIKNKGNNPVQLKLHLGNNKKNSGKPGKIPNSNQATARRRST